jgi:hypothetical protein
MIKNISLRFGSSSSEYPLSFSPGPITVIVGPNFSGKSKLIREVQHAVPVNVLRLTYRGGIATARMLPAEDITKMMRNPLLRSANVLSALFYDNVILTEGDTDRAFYQKVNKRLVSSGDRGVQNALFVNANGKDAIPVMMEPLRKLGVSVAAIYDIDFVKDGGTVSSRRLAAANVPAAMIASLGAARSALKMALHAADPEYKRHGGASLLSSGDKQSFDAYSGQLSSFGLFLVPVGEVEGWLSDLGVGGHAAQWLIPIFEKMGEEGSAAYLVPSRGDVWDFVDSLNAWFRNPARLGIN